jgi:preprotein translocase subunit YajC
MLVTPAYAQAAPGGGSDLLMQMLPFVLIFAIMYFLIIKPQQKRLKDHRDMIGNIRRGDTVVTGGGLIGKVTRVKDEGELEVEIGEGTRVRVVKSMVSEVRAKGEPVKDGEKS